MANSDSTRQPLRSMGLEMQNAIAEFVQAKVDAFERETGLVVKAVTLERGSRNMVAFTGNWDCEIEVTL